MRPISTPLLPLATPRSVLAALLLSLITNLGSAALTTFSLSIPVTFLHGTSPAASLGDQLSEVFTYDGDMIPIQTLGDFRVFIPPDGSVFTEFNLAGLTYSLDNHFELALVAKQTFEAQGQLIYGDFARFIATGDPMTGPDGTTVSLYSQMMFPAGTFGTDARLPDFAPAWAFTSFGATDANGGSWFAQGETAVGPGLNPIPEPSTYGLMVSLGLIGLAARRLRSAFLQRKNLPL